jgi:hypothetical protein
MADEQKQETQLSQAADVKKEDLKANPPHDRQVQLMFDNVNGAKISVPHRENLNHHWTAFCNLHRHVSDKHGAYPAMFANELVMKHGCHELPDDAKTTEVAKFVVE